MTVGIIHHESTKHFLEPLLESISGIPYHVCVIDNTEKKGRARHYPTWIPNPINGFELGALKCLMDTFFRESDFFLLQETCLIKDKAIFDIAAKFDGALAMSHGFMSFLGKYRRETVEKLGLPVPKDRLAEIYYEHFWNLMYINLETKVAVCDDPLKDSEVFENKFGKKRMRLENAYMVKWKSNWGGVPIHYPQPPIAA